MKKSSVIVSRIPAYRIMEYERFEQHISAIKDLIKTDCKIARFINSNIKENTHIGLYDIAIYGMINILSDAMHDEHNYIRYFIWDLDWGKNPDNLNYLETKDLKPVKGKVTLKKLYNLL